jgi:poly(3-hydroxyalkanoate) synthetase
MAAASLNDIARMLDVDGAPAPPPREPLVWTTPHRVALEMPTMRLRDFSSAPGGRATLICAPYALHGATVADFAVGHSIIETLRAGGLPRIHLTEWRPAEPDMRFFSVDTYLAELNVAVDELGAPVDLVGLCQGGWLALVYAARFPHKVRRLVMAGAPVDLEAAPSGLTRLTRDTPLAFFEQLVRLGEGRVYGHRMLDLWSSTAQFDSRNVLQLPEGTNADLLAALDRRFADWYRWTYDLPGTYYLQVVSWLYHENRLARGRFVALGRTIDLGAVRHPLFLLAARDDELVASEQLFATARYVATPVSEIAMVTEPCGHLGLFMGANTVTRTWANIARWLAAGDEQKPQAAA